MSSGEQKGVLLETAGFLPNVFLGIGPGPWRRSGGGCSSSLENVLEAWSRRSDFLLPRGPGKEEMIEGREADTNFWLHALEEVNF